MKVNSLFSKYILFILGIISLMPGMAYSQTFKHFQDACFSRTILTSQNDHIPRLRLKMQVVEYSIAIFVIA